MTSNRPFASDFYDSNDMGASFPDCMTEVTSREEGERWFEKVTEFGTLLVTMVDDASDMDWTWKD
jgi:hypothetical protein